MTRVSEDARAAAAVGLRRHAVVVALATAVLLALTPPAQARSESLEPLDPVMEDTVVPEVFVPAGDALGPVGNETQGMLFTTEPTVVPPPFPAHLWLSNIAAGVPITAADLLLNTAAGEPRGSAQYWMWLEWGANGEPWSYNSFGLTGTEGVPRAVDLSGNGLYDITVEVRDITTTPTLRVTRLPGAPAPLSAGISAWLVPFGPSAAESVSLTLWSEEFPALATIALTDMGFESHQIVANITTIEPGEWLYVSAVSRFGSGSGDYIPLAETLSPVPEKITLTS